jgi:hypothetical protein
MTYRERLRAITDWRRLKMNHDLMQSVYLHEILEYKEKQTLLDYLIEFERHLWSR